MIEDDKISDIIKEYVTKSVNSSYICNKARLCLDGNMNKTIRICIKIVIWKKQG